MKAVGFNEPLYILPYDIEDRSRPGCSVGVARSAQLRQQRSPPLSK